MPPYPIKESYNWVSPEFTYNDAPGNKVIIRGPALFSVEKHFDKGVSQNVRRYVQDEIIRSARTLKGKYVDVNHEFSIWKNQGEIGPKPRLKGHIIFGEEENGTVEYVAEVNHKEYVQKIRDTDKVRQGKLTKEEYFTKWGKHPLQGVSVDADFYHYKCPICNEKFYTSESYTNHMHNIEHIKNFEWEPHQIVFNGLSLVEPPESPGVKGADFEIIETTQVGLSQLLETVIKTKKEQEEMTKKKETTVPYRHRDTIREQDEPEKDEHGCIIGKERWNGTECVPTATEQDEHGCGSDEEWDGEKCVPKKQPEATEQATPAPNVGTQSEGEPEKLACPEGFHLVTDDQGNQKCEPDLPPPPIDRPPAAVETEDDVLPVSRPPEGTGATVTVSDQAPCPEGQHRDPETDLCIVDATIVEPEPNIQMETVNVPTLLRLGEPFAGYSSMDDCIAKNPDKEDPAAYCATIMRKVEGEQTSEIKESHNIYETQQAIMKSLKEIRNIAIVRDAKIAAKVNNLTRTVASTLTGTNKLVESINKTLKKNEADAQKLIKTVESAAQVNLLSEKKQREASTKKIYEQIVADTKKVLETTKSLKEDVNKEFSKITDAQNQLREYTSTNLGKLATSIAKNNQTLSKVNPKIVANFEAANKRIDEIANQLTEHTASLSANSKRIDEVANLATEQKKDFETILAEADKNAGALKEQVKSLEDWKAEKEKQVKETAAKQEEANQTAKALKEVVEPLQTEIENLKASLKGFTKQKHPDAIPKPEELETDKLPYGSEND